MWWREPEQAAWVVTRELARRVLADGLAVGLDMKAALLGLARELAGGGAVARRMDLIAGDARWLPLGDAMFDVVVAATTLSHVPGGARAIPELVRVTRPGGRLGVFKREGDTLIVSHPDRSLTRRIVAAFSDHAIVDSWLGRRLPGLLAEAGLEDVRVCGFIPLERDPSGYYADFARRAADIAARSGRISLVERPGRVRVGSDPARAAQTGKRFGTRRAAWDGGIISLTSVTRMGIFWDARSAGWNTGHRRMARVSGGSKGLGSGHGKAGHGCLPDGPIRPRLRHRELRTLVTAGSCSLRVRAGGSARRREGGDREAHPADD